MFWFVVIAIPVICFLLNKFIRSLKVKGFADKYVFITGCDTGFGKDLAHRLDGLGFHVLAGCLTEDGAKSLSQSCSSRLETIPLDVGKAESIASAVKIVKDKIPTDKGLWALVNNAGIGGPWSPTELCTKDDFLPVFNINFLGLAETTRLCLPLVRKAQGRIVNMASAAGILAFVAPTYTCSKFAVEAYSDVLRREMYSYGVKVIILEPGVFRTNIVNVDIMVDLVKKTLDKASQEVKDFYGPGLLDRYRARFTEFFNSGSPNVSIVVDAYTHAITARYPCRRYPLGFDCKAIFLPLSYLPAWFVDWFMALQVYKQGV